MSIRTIVFVTLLVMSLSVSNAGECTYARGERLFVIPSGGEVCFNKGQGVFVVPVEIQNSIGEENWSAMRVAKETLSAALDEGDLFFISEEIRFINRGRVRGEDGRSVDVSSYDTGTPIYSPGTELRVPTYVKKNVRCGDLRNWHVAVMKGSKHGVSPRLLLGIRVAENPNNDSYAYGVKAKRGTNLWTQAEYAAQYVRRILGKKAMNPSSSDFIRLRRGYVQHSSASWDKTVPYIYRISLYSK